MGKRGHLPNTNHAFQNTPASIHGSRLRHYSPCTPCSNPLTRTCFLGSCLCLSRHLCIPQRPLAAPHRLHRQTGRGGRTLRKAAGICRRRPAHLWHTHSRM
jgi:hypothetical protein